MRIGSLFSGAGGLDMAVEAVFGGEVVWQSEMDKAASKVLAYRFPCAPNFGISRNDQLRIVGNGVVPQQAIAALTYLLKVAEVEA